jgi:CBS domain-containing protein
MEASAMTTAFADPRIDTLMSRDPITVAPDEFVVDAERLLKTYRISGLPVVANGAVIGVISQSDLVVARSSAMISGHWDRLRVRHLMSTPAVTVHTTATVRYAAREMMGRHIHRLVVVGDDGTPVGVVTSLDLLRAIVEDPAES